MFNKNFHANAFISSTMYTYYSYFYVICAMYVMYFRTLKYHLLSIFCFRHILKTDQFRSRTMEMIYFVNLIFIFVVNMLFFFSGICLNSLVIVSFWRFVQLRKKLCYFTIMILSCCDLLVALFSLRRRNFKKNTNFDERFLLHYEHSEQNILGIT